MPQQSKTYGLKLDLDNVKRLEKLVKATRKKTPRPGRVTIHAVLKMLVVDALDAIERAPARNGKAA